MYLNVVRGASTQIWTPMLVEHFAFLTTTLVTLSKNTQVLTSTAEKRRFEHL